MTSTSDDAGSRSVATQQRSPRLATVSMYLTFAVAVFVPYGFNVLVLVLGWVLALSITPRDIPRAVLLTLLALFGAAAWGFLPA